MSATRQWTLAPLAILCAFPIAGIVGASASSWLGFWDEPGAGACAAAAVVLCAYFSAPKYKLPFAACAFVVGAAVAWALLEPSWYPEPYGDLAYQRTHLPLIATYVGGGIGVAIACVHWMKARAEKTLRSTTLRDSH